MEEQTVNNQVQQPPVNPNTVSKKPNYWIIAVIVLLLIFVLGSIYILSQLPQRKISPPPPKPLTSPSPSIDPTANWKTYTNTQYELSFNYPGNWYISSDAKNVIRKNDNNPIFLGAIAPCIPNSQDCINSRQVITFQILHKPANLGIDKFAEDDPSLCQEVKTSNTYSYNLCTGLTELVNKKIVQVNGKEAIWIVTSGAPSGEKLEVLIPRNQKEIIMIHTYKNKTGSPYLDPEYIKILDQILSTFKFTDEEEQVVCTQEARLCPDGKTYVGRQGPNCEFAPCP